MDVEGDLDIEVVVVKSGRTNLALTVFFPYDCDKNCSFCTTKALYKEITSMEKVLESMDKVLSKNIVQDVVISGGEPLSNIPELHRLISRIPSHYNIYINTSFPVIEPSEEWIDILRMIDGINVSRHKEHDYSAFGSYEHIIDATQGMVPVRINILLNNHIDSKNIWVDSEWNEYLRNIMSYEYFDIQLRANYIKTNNEGTKTFTLKDYNDRSSQFIKSFGSSWETGCNVCSSIYARYGSNTISFHKGVSTTSIDRGDYLEVNDIIIYPNGTTKLDWVGKPVDIDSLKWID